MSSCSSCTPSNTSPLDRGASLGFGRGRPFAGRRGFFGDWRAIALTPSVVVNHHHERVLVARADGYVLFPLQLTFAVDLDVIADHHQFFLGPVREQPEGQFEPALVDDLHPLAG